MKGVEAAPLVCCWFGRYQCTTVRRLCPAFFAKIAHRRRPPGASPGAPFAEIKLICIKLIPKTRGQPYCRKAFPSLKVRDGPPPESLAVSVPPVAPRRPEKSRTKYDLLFAHSPNKSSILFGFFLLGRFRSAGPPLRPWRLAAFRPGGGGGPAGALGLPFLRCGGASAPRPAASFCAPSPPLPPCPPAWGAGGVRTGGGLAAASPCAAPSACRP